MIYIDVASSDGTMAVTRRALQDEFLVDIAMNETFMAVYPNGGQFTGGHDSIDVLDTETLAPLASFVNDKTGIDVPYGVAIAAGGLVLQRWTTKESTKEVAEFYGVESTGLTLRNRWTLYDAYKNAKGESVPVDTVGFGEYAVLEPTHQIVRIASQSGTMTPLRGVRQGSFERVRFATPDTVEVDSPYSMQIVDVSHPEAPVAKDGGLLAPVNVENLRFELSGESSRWLTTMDQPGPVTSLYWTADDGSLPQVAGSLANDDDRGHWAASRRYLYQLSEVDARNLRLRRFPTAGLTTTERQTLVADIDQTIPCDAPAELTKRTAVAVAVEPRTGDVVISDIRATADAAYRDMVTVTTWLTEGDGGYRKKYTRPAVQGGATRLAVSGKRAALWFGSSRIDLIDDTGETRATYTPVSAEIGRYATPALPTSMDQTSGKLVVGMPSGLLVAAPACPGLAD